MTAPGISGHVGVEERVRGKTSFGKEDSPLSDRRNPNEIQLEEGASQRLKRQPLALIRLWGRFEGLCQRSQGSRIPNPSSFGWGKARLGELGCVG